MSMISAQIDELRRYADMEDGTFPLLASALRDAADTIWQLRDDLQQANAAVQDAEHDESMAWDRVRKAEAENAKLRVERDEWHRVAASKQDIIDHMRNANSENAKLRKLVQDYHTFLALAELAQPIGYIVAAHGHPTLSVAALDERYRELGVEVDG